MFPQIWQRHRRSIVGSTARFSGPAAYLLRGQCFNGVLTNSAFLPTDLMREYFKPTGPAAQVRAHVDKHQNCEDIGINFVAAAATEPNMDAPVFVEIWPVLILHRYSCPTFLSLFLRKSTICKTRQRSLSNTSQ
jgi:hypothetical protein